MGNLHSVNIDLNVSMVFFNIKEVTQWIIYMTPILIFSLLFCSLVLVIKSLQSILFSLEYKIIKYLD